MQDSLPLARRRLRVGAVLLAVVLLVGGRLLLRAGTARAPAPAVAAATLRAETAPKLVVHVVGAVRRPGLYQLPQRSRIADAVERAGGAARGADLSAVNLAALLADGAQVVVPTRAPPAGAGAPGGGTEPGAAAGSQGPVHLNTATLEQLDALPGVGPVTTQCLRRRKGETADPRAKHPSL